MKINYSVILLIILAMPAGRLSAQSETSHFRKGNDLYEKGKFNDAEIEYRKGLEKNKDSWTGQYNLANSLYRQEKYAEAAKILDSLRSSSSDKSRQSKIFHNLGNSLLKEKQYEQSIEAFKQALKLDPGAEDSRYNLSYAYQMLRKQQQQQQQQQQQKENKDKKEEKQEQKQQQQKQDQDKKQEEQKQNIDREEAERMLDALDRQEKQLRKEQEKKEQRPGVGGSGKDW
ncbi:MAG: tetratricopeptide repeat protein [Bacteroidetes bacterium]|nr:tetratricopeptide repeat protein [Bacteroidota bacterium]